MKITDIVLKTRSYRRFDEACIIDYKVLEQLVDLARLSASSSNRQPLKYMIISSVEDCQKVFPTVAWAGYLKDWNGPGPGERPTGYVIILGDKSITETFGVDPGIAAQTIMLGATEAGLGGCMIASIQREQLRKAFRISEKYDILLILALGKPAENVIIDKIKDDDVKYWRDEHGNHHVPKRSLDELIIKY